MNILLIGNGFDLAHGLPTKYIDFLHFLRLFISMEEYHGNYPLFHDQRIKSDSYSDATKKQIDEVYRNVLSLAGISTDINRDIQLNTLFKRIFSSCLVGDEILIIRDYARLLSLADNFWYKHFINLDCIKTGWIDFESEISKIIQKIHALKRRLELGKKEDITYDTTILMSKIMSAYVKYKLNISQRNMEYINVELKEPMKFNSITFDVEDFAIYRDFLVSQLRNFINGLNVYLRLFVEQFEINLFLPDINDINFDHVLNFNYTNTLKRKYSNRDVKAKICHIHGMVNKEASCLNCNIILGIDDYLDDFESSKDTFFIQFKKFYQRIHKKTDFNYLKWVDEAQKCEGNNMYIFGHSLDITDKDVLQKFICIKNIKNKNLLSQ